MKRIIGFILLLCTLGACTKSSLEAIWSAQEEKIDSYINSLPKQPDATDPEKPYVKDIVRNGGSNRIIFLDGNGEKLQEGGTVTFYYAGYVFNSGINKNSMFATNNEHLAKEAGWNVTDGDFNAVTINLGHKNELIEGLRNGLTGVRASEVCLILFSGEYGYGKKPFGVIPGNSALAYQIWVKSVAN